MIAIQLFTEPARVRGNVRIVKIVIEKSESLELDLKAKNNNNKTGYQLAAETFI